MTITFEAPYRVCPPWGRMQTLQTPYPPGPRAVAHSRQLVRWMSYKTPCTCSLMPYPLFWLPTCLGTSILEPLSWAAEESSMLVANWYPFASRFCIKPSQEPRGHPYWKRFAKPPRHGMSLQARANIPGYRLRKWTHVQSFARIFLKSLLDGLLACPSMARARPEMGRLLLPRLEWLIWS